MDLEEYSVLILTIALCFMMLVSAAWTSATMSLIDTPQGVSLVVLTCIQWFLVILALIGFWGWLSSEGC